ncbi:MFS transporter [Streptantibioticus silvisoli]|uniref:MFS transporter n=1 Tax=Streptantibioticus silvisoli TaxID=2705255 RepID=A0ABT6VU54_9ACTN|nr:MFS transporter [Streptantibioticus silvisoli]MDI5962006.1 MFS transporter [Streptantibioticus silvisoli]
MAGTPDGRAVGARTRRARVAVTAVFFVHGAVFASWAARIPEVKDQLHLSAGVLGLVLAGPGVGALAGSQVGGLAVRRFGGRAISGCAPLVLCLPLGLVPLARSAGMLAALLVLLGAADGATSVAMNAQALAVQRVYGRSVLNAMHAVRSLGAVAGGLAAAATAALSLPQTDQFVVTAVTLATVSALAACGLQPEQHVLATGELASAVLSTGEVGEVGEVGDTGEVGDAGGTVGVVGAAGSNGSDGSGGSGGSAGPGGSGDVRDPSEPGVPAGRARQVLLALALMAFFGSLIEDAPASWSGVYLRHAGAGAAVAATGYAAFCAGEVATRMLNDRLVDRLGWVRLIRTGTLGCAVVLTVALLVGRPAVMLAALVCAGAGVSAVFPGAFAGAGALPGSGPALAQVGFAGNAGWLAVSPLIGGLATAAGLSVAFGLLPLAALVIAALAGATRAGTPSGVARRGDGNAKARQGARNAVRVPRRK